MRYSRRDDRSVLEDATVVEHQRTEQREDRRPRVADDPGDEHVARPYVGRRVHRRGTTARPMWVPGRRRDPAELVAVQARALGARGHHRPEVGRWRTVAQRPGCGEACLVLAQRHALPHQVRCVGRAVAHRERAPVVEREVEHVVRILERALPRDTRASPTASTASRIAPPLACSMRWLWSSVVCARH